MSKHWLYVAGMLAMLSTACSGTAGGSGDRGSVDGGDDGGNAGNGSNGDSGGSRGGDNQDSNGSADGGTGDNGSDIDASLGLCGLTVCGAGQRCDTSSGSASCVDLACSDLSCGDLAECTPALGGGHLCKSIACGSDVQCGDARFCDGSKCTDDVCEASAQRCDGNQVYQCASNGGADEARFSCAGAAYFESTCDDAASGAVGCTCQDDWDCPSYTACNAGRCEGTGLAPTCTLPSLPFEQVLPTREFLWGGDPASGNQATGRPFPNYVQVVTTPVVANLDDDNGDGLINELDFPEIIFMAYAGSGDGVHRDGAVRAVHGGGPKRGEDYFALCGTKHWISGDDIAAATCTATEGATRPGGGVAVGDLDYDGVPEIVVATKDGKLQILNNRGAIVSTSAAIFIAQGAASPDNDAWKYPQVGLANLDNSGLVEVIVGNRVVTLEKTSQGVLQTLDVFKGTGAEGAQDDGTRHFGPTACPANVIDASADDEDASQEIVVGTVLYKLPTAPVGVSKRADCAGGDSSDFCTGTLTLVWDARVVNNTVNVTQITNREGYCAVADVLGADTSAAPGPGNALDGVPEVILVSNGRLLILRADTGVLLRKIDVQADPTRNDQRGGAPNIDDFDGDGFPEVAMASSGFYTVIDLQEPEAMQCPAWAASLSATEASPGSNPARNPGGSCTSNAQCEAGSVCNTTVSQCVCLHNGWKRITEDDSSKATSSSVFDFNGDGAAEVVYGDECYFRIYDGISGTVRLAVPAVSRTVLENPVVADVDNDGNAEIVFVSNNETLQCSQNTLTNPDGTTIAKNLLPNGIQVWGDASDTWVSARRVWNQHAYHVTNVTESGHIPLREPESWKPYGNRVYNTYRSQPRAFGVAPDLSLIAMQVSSPDVACGQLSNELEITVLVKNLGDLRVGPGVQVTFYGAWGAAASTPALRDATGQPLVFTLQTSLEPGASVLATVPFRAQDNPENALPDRVIAVIDEAGAERECKEDNNRIEQAVAPGAALADLRLEIGAESGPCTAKQVSVTVHNDGAVGASNVVVRLYAGDPSSGGQVLGETVLAGPIAPGASATGVVTAGDLLRNVRVYGVADPLDAVEECNNANNVDEGPMLNCLVILQ